MSFITMYLTEEHEAFRESFRDFLQKEVVPHIDMWEKTGTIERFIWKKFGEMGYFGIYQSETYGGLDLDLFYTVIFLEELQKINSGGFAAAMWAHAYLAMTHLKKEANHEQKEKYLTPSINGDMIGCLCITEPFGGSDVAGMRTTAVKKGDTYIINGSKTFITNGSHSTWFTVMAVTDPDKGADGISAFMVHADDEGFSVGPKEKKLGIWVNAESTAFRSAPSFFALLTCRSTGQARKAGGLSAASCSTPSSPASQRSASRRPAWSTASPMATSRR